MPAWTEEDDYFIHTYEGSYNNIVYQMLISYHRIGKCLTVSMFPKNVADLVDNPDIERMVCLYATGGTYIEELPDSYDMDFKTLLSDRPNLSTASDDFFKEKAYELTKKKIGIDLIDGSVVGEYNLSGYFNGTVLIEGGTTTFEVSDDENELEKTELLFLPEHIDDNLTGAVRSGYMYDVVEEFGSSGLYRSYIRYEGMTQPKMQNGGYLWVDDRGVVGFDITFGYNMKEIMSEDVPILTFENAMKAFEEAVRDNIDISKLGLADSKTKIYFKNAYFMYYPIPSPNKMGEYIFAPVWSIESVNGTITQSTTIINAMDGSLVEIFY
jgi:hypothetical protein